MDKTIKNAIELILLMIFLGLTSAAGAQDAGVRDIYLKSGSVEKCDLVWKGLGDFIWCNHGGNIKGYQAGQVDIDKTFDIQIEVSRLVNQSRISFEGRDWNGAIRAATAALSLDSMNEVAYTNRAGAYAEKGLLQEAIEDCDKAIGINPHFSMAYNNRGYVMERSGYIPKAVADYDLSCRMGNELACKNLKRVAHLP